MPRVKGPNGLVFDLDPVVASGLVGGASGDYSYADPEPDAAPAPAEPTAAEIRQWARDNDVGCPAKGRIPQAVLDAYQAAQEEQ